MLSTSRILAALLTGLGIALIVGGLLAPRFLIGDGRMPLDLEHTTWTMVDPAGEYEGETQPVTRQLHMEVQNPSNSEIASIRVGETLLAGESENDFDNLVSAGTWTFSMDRRTGMPTGPLKLSNVMVLPETEVGQTGNWLKLPANAERTTYQVFDSTLRGTAPANFAGEDEIEGRTVYRYTQDIEPTNLALRYADMRNTKTQVDSEGNQTRSFLYYAAQRELIVDQVSGLVVGVNEKVDTYYGDAQGARVEDVVRYDARMPQEQTASMVSQLDGVFSQRQSQAVTTTVIVVGAILTLIGLVGALRPGRGYPGSANSVSGRVPTRRPS
ncbi:DUF3068 domain-containing protein [Corynebacterium lipophiloflavum]|uniref:DUF3068 domain-containing protein n=1 Tax=Corynebacterium lipophiloflavum (strain ATCC 700352 / DSM 44291 / CCUG 37336 / JCM 10383 / DMMZ 1944) TaxID=525263 RepID=C0XUK2_CORLD|nr:DUF3068 domain-containing protein [Corynebacterium lipophiloflavum]EEI16027.1 hypothetical protein HMPREF0298_2122 [Corynebacterium lipophiloflavum DSM 44291]